MTRSRPTRRCENCGARVAPEGNQACAFCGMALPVAASPVLTKAQRFELLRVHPSCPRLLERKPCTAGLMRIHGLVFFGLCATAAVSGMIAFAGWTQGDPQAFVPLATGVIAIAVLVLLMRRAAQRAREGLRAVPALVVRKQERWVVYTSGNNVILAVIDPPIWAAASIVDAARDTSSRATIETYDGKRLDLELVEALERTVEPGDLGIAYVAAGYLVDFARVEG
jgi:hypothetical protein